MFIVAASWTPCKRCRGDEGDRGCNGRIDEDSGRMLGDAGRSAIYYLGCMWSRAQAWGRTRSVCVLPEVLIPRNEVIIPTWEEGVRQLQRIFCGFDQTDQG